VSSGVVGIVAGMLSTTTGQVGFFNAAGLVGPLPEGSFFALLAEHGERIVRDEDFADSILWMVVVWLLVVVVAVFPFPWWW
jgi:ABC-type spermidine/putrescine transport system permease subunit I